MAWCLIKYRENFTFAFSIDSNRMEPITVAARCKAWTVFAHSNIGVVGSNPPWGIDVCGCLFSVPSCVQVAALRWTDTSSKEPYRLCKNQETESGQGPAKGSRAVDRQ
jgi:hypothetical protein